MKNVVHLKVGAAERTWLTRDDGDRLDLVRRVVAAMGTRLLAWCAMGTHLHVVGEGEDAVPLLDATMVGYIRSFNERHGLEGLRLRGRTHVTEIESPGQLVATIRYVHENPIKTKKPLAPSAIAWEWSSARAYAGLARAPLPNFERARALLARRTREILVAEPLSELAPTPVPTASPPLLLAAAATAFGLEATELSSRQHVPEIAVYVRLGTLQRYREEQLALPLGKSRQRISQLKAVTPGARFRQRIPESLRLALGFVATGRSARTAGTTAGAATTSSSVRTSPPSPPSSTPSTRAPTARARSSRRRHAGSPR